MGEFKSLSPFHFVRVFRYISSVFCFGFVAFDLDHFRRSTAEREKKHEIFSTCSGIGCRVRDFFLAGQESYTHKVT